MHILRIKKKEQKKVKTQNNEQNRHSCTVQGLEWLTICFTLMRLKETRSNSLKHTKYNQIQKVILTTIKSDHFLLQSNSDVGIYQQFTINYTKCDFPTKSVSPSCTTRSKDFPPRCFHLKSLKCFIHK